ncbi:hypothetical protein ABEF93_008574 [Exophiala dermatitidis]
MPPRRKRLSSIQLPSKPAWLTIDLASCTVQYRDHPEAIQWSRDLKRKEAEGTPEKWYLQLSHDRANSGRMAMRVVGPDNQLIATVSFPDFDTSVDVYVYQETYRIEVRKHQKGTIKILEMYSFRLGVASDATTATKLFEQIRRSLSKWVTGEDANLAIIPANGAEQITNVVDDLPQATAAKNILPKDWGCCGRCKQGQAPSDITHIRTRRFRKEWIGCISGLECLSFSYWFHANATCAKISSGDMKKKGRLNWFCEICRTEGFRTGQCAIQWLKRPRS